jgi:hypothetical protein
MSKIDWSKAPEEATHYNLNNYMFYKVVDKEVYIACEGEWFVSTHNVDDFVKHSTVIPRPSKQEWDGKGLPPVGVECGKGCVLVV